MNAQQLKNAILQEAIEGRLVPQDPNDEPASVLLARIRKEKERLVKEGKLKKKDLEVKPISENEIPFEIPESWEWCRISSLFETSSGSTPQSKNPKYYSNGSINWVRTTDLNNGALSSCEIQITKEAVADYHLSIIPRDSICIAMYGGGGTIGKHSIIKFNTTINQSVCAIFPNGMCNMDFVHYFMQYQRPNWMDYAAGSRKDPNINQVIIKNCLFPLPPLAEQLRIVGKLNELLPKVEEYGKAQDALNKLNAELPERLKKSILQEAIEGRLVPQDPNDEPASVLLDKIRQEKAQLVKAGKLKKKDLIETPISEDEIPFEIPESWEWCRIKQLYETTSGGTPEKGHPEYYGGKIPWVKVGDLISKYIGRTDECITEEGLSHSSAKLFPKGTILVAMYCNDAIGKSSIIDLPMTTNQAICGLFPNKYVYTDYIYYTIQANRSLIQEKAAGGAQKNINQKIVNDMIIPLPPLAEQHRIVEKLEQLLGEIDKLKK